MITTNHMVELAEAIARQLGNLADGKYEFPGAAVRLIQNNAETLFIWSRSLKEEDFSGE